MESMELVMSDLCDVFSQQQNNTAIISSVPASLGLRASSLKLIQAMLEAQYKQTYPAVGRVPPHRYCCCCISLKTAPYLWIFENGPVSFGSLKTAPYLLDLWKQTRTSTVISFGLLDLSTRIDTKYAYNTSACRSSKYSPEAH